jgi:hypothetical protein
MEAGDLRQIDEGMSQINIEGARLPEAEVGDAGP